MKKLPAIVTKPLLWCIETESRAAFFLAIPITAGVVAGVFYIFTHPWILGYLILGGMGVFVLVFVFLMVWAGITCALEELSK